MLIKVLQNQFTTKLTPIYDELEAQQIFLFCLDELEGKSRIDLAMNPELKTEKSTAWLGVLDELVQAKPVQHIFQKAYFYGYTFQVNEHTLIPRPETEELVEWIIESAPKKAIRILDIGTGSGCIGLTLAKELPNSQVTLMDISPDALAVAKQNAQTLGVEVTCMEQDVLALDALSTTFDIIVSNPPYIRQLEKVEINQNVLAYEPHTALFVTDADPLIFYRKIAQLAYANLEINGQLFYEINQYLGAEMVDLLRQIGFSNTVLRQDLMQNDRMTQSIKS